MRFVNNTLMRLGILLVLAACATTEIPNIRVYKEIPFLDAAEGCYVETLSGDEGLVNEDDWADMRPYMIMIDPRGWTEIKKKWLEACRYAGDECNMEVESIDKVIRLLDDIARTVIIH